LLKHTQCGGEIIIDAVTQDNGSLITIIALDKEPGIADVSLSFMDGYSTAGTPGTGLGAIRRLANAFDIYTQPGLGTVIWAQVAAALPKISDHLVPPFLKVSLEAGGICIPLTGEQLCGDSWVTHFNPATATGFCMVVDGLGHGDGAHAAAQAAIQAFHLYKESNLSLMEIMQKLHAASHNSRGAALALAKIDLAQCQLEYAGVGNIAGTILTATKNQSLISHGGIIGHTMRTIRSATYPFPPNSHLIMHSDGLISHWNIKKYPGLLYKPTPIIASVLYRDYKRGRDDVTVVVVKNHIPAT
jgi:hypothetical protein